MDRQPIEYADGPARVATVNLSTALRALTAGGLPSGIEKRPTSDAVLVRAPGERGRGLGSGLAGDLIGDHRHHGGDDQAVYAYAREEIDYFEPVIGRAIANGTFGENLTTTGLDVSGAVIGERWQVGDDLVLVVRGPRIPCGTFRAAMGVRGWLKTFSGSALSGAYLSVAAPGRVRAGDQITVASRPEHGIRVCDLYRAMTTEPQRWDGILAAAEADLGAEGRAMARAKETYSIG